MQDYEIKHLTWDSNNFKINVGEILIDTIKFDGYKMSVNNVISTAIKEATLKKYNLLYLFLPDPVQIPIDFLNKDILLADKKVIFHKETNNDNEYRHTEDLSSINIYESTTITQQLLEIAFESGKYSRFKLDYHFSPEIFKLVYSTWLNRSVKKEIAHDILIYQQDQDIQGLLTYNIQDKVCTIGLIGVSPNHQHKRIGTKLLLKLEEILNPKEVDEIEVATQFENKIACSFYEHNGYKIKKIINVYHIWL